MYWYSANELGNTTYDIERTFYSDAGSSDWEVIETFYSGDKSSAKYYEFYDKPDLSGTVYYRVVQYDGFGNIQPSDVAKLAILEGGNEIVVAQNSPNPFLDETTIGFYLPQKSRVKIEVYDALGKLISVLADALFEAGNHEVDFSTFESENLASGVYLYKMQAGDITLERKMLLLK